MATSLNPTFNFSLNTRIVDKCATSAVLEEGGKETLVAVTTANKVLVKGELPRSFSTL